METVNESYNLETADNLFRKSNLERAWTIPQKLAFRNVAGLQLST